MLTDAQSCLICDRVTLIRNGRNDNFVCELPLSYVVVGDYQFFHGYTLLLLKEHKCELHELDNEEQASFLTEMACVAEAVYRTCKPRKLNYELLGNDCPHMHWHLFPRYDGDPSPNTTSWKIDKSIRYNEQYRLSGHELLTLKNRLLTEIIRTCGELVRSRFDE
jgi:diadenosine tetraphosphate (Ap4A) HIT family hydrolase